MKILGPGPARLQRDGKRKPTLRVECDCGQEFVALAYNIRAGATRSCGCLRRRTASAAGKARKTLGVTTDPAMKRTRTAWRSMMGRCYYPQNASYPRYGGVGVLVHSAWHTFPGFYADMGLRPGPEYTLERLDNSKGYVPGNVRWATRAEQARNRRNNINITVGGATMCAQDWATSLGVALSTVLRRHRRGLPPSGGA